MFESLIYLPVAVPRLEFDPIQLCEWYDQNKTRGYEEYVKSIGYPWNVIWLRDLDKGLVERADTLSMFPNFYQCLQTLPHVTIRKMYILEQVIDVEPHRDISREDDPSLGPSTYRCMLLGQPKSLYYLRGAEVEPGESPLYPKFDIPGEWFVHNNHNSRHGAIKPPDGQRKLILCVWGVVDRDKHFELLARSHAVVPSRSLV